MSIPRRPRALATLPPSILAQQAAAPVAARDGARPPGDCRPPDPTDLLLAIRRWSYLDQLDGLEKAWRWSTAMSEALARYPLRDGPSVWTPEDRYHEAAWRRLATVLHGAHLATIVLVETDYSDVIAADVRLVERLDADASAALATFGLQQLATAVERELAPRAPVRVVVEPMPGSPGAWDDCPRCGGSGWRSDDQGEECGVCDGFGTVQPGTYLPVGQLGCDAPWARCRWCWAQIDHERARVPGLCSECETVGGVRL